jgi:hypothetical protein
MVNVTGRGRLRQAVQLGRGAKHNRSRPLAAIEITYAEPVNPLHRNLHDVLRQHEALEKVQAILSPFRLPRTVAMRVQGCNGEAEAWYENAAITVCYEYLDEVWRSAPNDRASTGIDRIDAIVGPLVDVFLHEFGHALFDLLAIPVLGREEDAADQVAAFLMLQFQREEARRLIRGTAHLYRTWVRQGPWFNRTDLRGHAWNASTALL